MTTINVIVSRYHKDTEWTNRLSSATTHKVNVYVYDKAEPDVDYKNDKFIIPKNKGYEVSSYLKYIIDFYDNLPDWNFFTHDDEFAWHHSGSIVDKFKEAISKFEEGKEFYNINDNSVFWAMETSVDQWKVPLLEFYSNYINEIIPLHHIPHGDWMFGYHGSAQFMVHAKRIRTYTKEYYKSLYKFVMDTTYHDYGVARFFEYTWHVLWDIYHDGFMSIEDRFNNLIENRCKGPIRLLADYVKECQTIVEIGDNAQQSTYAIFQGICTSDRIEQEFTRVNYYFTNEIVATKVYADYCKVKLNLIQISSLHDIDCEQDLVFIDSIYSYGELLLVLNACKKTKKYIVIYGTQRDAKLSGYMRLKADNIKLNARANINNINSKDLIEGMSPAISTFLIKNKDWKLCLKTEDENGLTVLKRK